MLLKDRDINVDVIQNRKLDFKEFGILFNEK
jgi:hypothetical protein